MLTGCPKDACPEASMHACRLSSEIMLCSAGSRHTAVAVDPGVLDTALAHDYFRSEVCCAAEAQPY